MAEENRGWGHRRIQGALDNLGHVLAHKTIASVLKQHGIEPAPDRSTKTTWKEFLTRHWHQIVASDFFTIEEWTSRGLQRFIVLFFIDLSTRRVELAGIAQQPKWIVDDADRAKRDRWSRRRVAATCDAATRRAIRQAAAHVQWKQVRTFRWEYYCAECREYRCCGSKALGYMVAR